MTDFENKVKQALNARVDDKLGSGRPAPVFDPDGALTRPEPRGPRGPGGGRAPWMLPLIAAASVVAVTIGAVAATSVLADKKRVPPATSAPVPTPTPQLTSPSVTPKASPSKSTVTNSHTSGHSRASNRSHTSAHGTAGATTVNPPAPVVVTLGGASITLPPGWVSRDYSQYLPAGSSPTGGLQWCLTPSTLAASTDPGACPVSLGTIDPGGPAIDVDVEGGYSSNPAYCGDTSSTVQEQTGDRQLGGRSADWRHWSIGCGNGSRFEIEQYVVATGPGFVLFSATADQTVQDAMASIASKSTLPSSTAALRYMDRGYVRSADPMSDGVHITLDRAIDGANGVVNDDPQTYDYLVPTEMYDAATVSVGDLVTLDTDGSVVTSFAPSPH